jgi:hypothetical protein
LVRILSHFVAPIGLLVAITNSTLSKSADIKELYLECNLNTIVIRPKKLTDNQTQHYLIDENSGELWRYDETTNIYNPMCVLSKGVTCTLSKDSFSLKQYFSEATSLTTNSISINRWSGTYHSYSKLSLKTVDFAIEVFNDGVCKPGYDRRLQKRKF